MDKLLSTEEPKSDTGEQRPHGMGYNRVFTGYPNKTMALEFRYLIERFSDVRAVVHHVTQFIPEFSEYEWAYQYMFFVNNSVVVRKYFDIIRHWPIE